MTEWTGIARRHYSRATLTLLSGLLTDGREAFRVHCEAAGFKPNEVLSKRGLSAEDETYGFVLTDE